jgi:hypothetical protein
MSDSIPWDEWRRLQKAPRSGGVQSSIGPGPGFGMLGQTGVPVRVPGQGSNGPGPSARSKYTFERQSQPPGWIDDVDTGSNWYSPFEPITPFGPPYITRPRDWDFPVGYNLNYIPQRMELMAMLRGMRASWGVLATIIATRQDQLLRIPWTIQRKDKPKQKSVAVEDMRKFFKSPDGKRSYSQWTRLLTDDLLVLDAPTVYFTRDRRGRPLNAEVLDGATIFPLIDDAGRRPDSIVELSEDGLNYIRRQPAFQQIIKGLPMIDLDESELMYVPMRSRTNLPMFGYPATEQILIETSEAIRKTFYQLDFWREGTIPDLIVSVPEQWSPRQIAMFQAHFDALLSGNLKLKSKVRFLPGGMKPFDVKNSSGESLWSQRDETLIRLACYAYSVSPAPFIKMLNRSTAQNAQQMAEEEGLYPLMSFWKDDIIDPIIQSRFGYDDIEFTFLPKPEPDQEKAAKIHDLKLKSGTFTINEVRDENGLEPVKDGDTHLIYVGNAVIPLAQAAQGKAMPMVGGQEPGDSKNGNSGGSIGSSKSPARGAPMRGPASSGSSGVAARTSTQKLLMALFKVSHSDVTDAAAESEGDIDRVSTLQQKIGNYKKGHIWIQGLNISIENEKGSYRGEKDQSGTKWQVKMPAPYGYIRGTIGADNMAVDVYLGTDPESDTVWVIDQDKVDHKGKNKGFDEHKVMFGYPDMETAVGDYLLSHFDGYGHERLWRVTELSTAELKTWLKDGDLKEPIAHTAGKVVLKRKKLKRILGKAADTISTSTGLNWYDQTLGVPRKRRRTAKRERRRQGPRWLQLNARNLS